MLNIHSQAAIHDAAFHASVLAVRDGFPHLPHATSSTRHMSGLMQRLPGRWSFT